MKKQEQEYQAKTYCQKCRRFVRTANYLIHDARCKGEDMSESRVSMSQQRNRSSNIFSNLSSQRYQKQQQIQEEKIPCPFCGYAQSLTQLDTHPNNCIHRDVQCEGCKSHYPISLIEQHEVECPANRRRQHSPERQQQLQQPMMFSSILGQRRRALVPGNRDEPEDFQEQRRNQLPPLLQMIELMGNSRRPRSNLGLLINILAGVEMGKKNEGLSKQQIKSLTIQKYHQKEKDQEPDLCTICYCQFEQNQQIMNLPCKHIYHPDCITQWLQNNHKCPVCKQSVGGEKNQRNQGSQEQEEDPRRNELFFFHRE